MSLWRDLAGAWAAWADRLAPAPARTIFTHDLPDFPAPERRPLPDPPPEVVVATPCRDAEPFLDRYGALIDGLDYPTDRLHLVLAEGDSADATRARAAALLEARRGRYASTRLLTHDLGVDVDRDARHRVGLQRRRRAGIAAVRNALLRAAMETAAEFVLFVDVDLVEVPPDALRRLLEWRAPILVANCLQETGDRVFDINTFRYTRPVSDRLARRFAGDGLYQPPAGLFRHYPDPHAADEIAPVHAVGGTFLLIRRDVIAAGADFPETPYQLHLETEGLALKAADLGFGAWVLPRLIVRHHA